MATQLYLISPPRIELGDFRKSLEEALSINTSPLRGEVDALASGGGDSYKTLPPSLPLNAHPRPAHKGGGNFVGAFQLRLKEADDETIKRAIRELMPICRDHEVAFIINDRPDLCADLKCDGVHVGQEDLSSYQRKLVSSKTKELDPDFHRDDSIEHIRKIIGNDAVIGVTCHASRHLAMEAGEAGADYVAFGAFYETTSKPAEKLEKWGTPTPEILEWWSTYMTLPCVAIGGITPSNCKKLVDAGADFIAVITAVWNHPKGVKAAIEEFKKELL